MIRIARASRAIALGSLILLVVAEIASGVLRLGNHQASQSSQSSPAPAVRQPARPAQH